MMAPEPTLTVVAAALVVLALGYLVVFAMSRLPATAEGAGKVWPILNVEAGVVLAVCAVFAFAPILIPLAMLAFVPRVAWEAAAVRLPPADRGRAMAWAGGSALALMLALVLPWHNAAAILCVAWIGAAVWRWRQPERATPDLLVFPVLPALAFATACAGTNPAIFLAAWIGIETFDSYALLSGKVFGRRKAFPVLSPNKTIEGLAGGTLMLLLTAMLAAAFMPDFGIGQAVAFALLIGIFSVIGDLTASLMKRRAGVKDFPALIPHQGGLFDMFDSWIATGGALAALLVLGLG